MLVIALAASVFTAAGISTQVSAMEAGSVAAGQAINLRASNPEETTGSAAVPAALPSTGTAVATASVIEEGTGLYLNGLFLGAVKQQDNLSGALQSLLETYKEEGATVHFLENVETRSGLYASSSLYNLEDFMQALTQENTEIPWSYLVQEGDTLESIANLFQTTPEAILETNPDIQELSQWEEGIVLKLFNQKPLLHVQSIKKENYTEEVPFEILSLSDNSRYTTYQNVLLAGQKGSQICTDLVTYVDGEEVSRQAISRDVVSMPVTQMQIVGTLTPPDGSTPGEASGTFTWPTPSILTVSSEFGSRWGTLHAGLDLSNGSSYGETIVAADAGTVEYVKKDNYGYGYHLEIDHGNGMSTLYAHTSEILVNPGEKVFKGQPIAYVGSTGDSTGAHLHFEIHVDGTAVNPREYVEVPSA